jgi:hypothetical protein
MYDSVEMYKYAAVLISKFSFTMSYPDDWKPEERIMKKCDSAVEDLGFLAAVRYRRCHESRRQSRKCFSIKD